MEPPSEKEWGAGNGSAPNPIQENHNQPEKPPRFPPPLGVRFSSLPSFLQSNVGLKRWSWKAKSFPSALPKPGRCSGSAQLTTRQQQDGKGLLPSRPSKVVANSTSATSWNYGSHFFKAVPLGLSAPKNAVLQGGRQRTPHLLLRWVHGLFAGRKTHQGLHIYHQHHPYGKTSQGSFPSLALRRVWQPANKSSEFSIFGLLCATPPPRPRLMPPLWVAAFNALPISSPQGRTENCGVGEKGGEVGGIGEQ